jgi:hypothetical protein
MKHCGQCYILQCRSSFSRSLTMASLLEHNDSVCENALNISANSISLQWIGWSEYFVFHLPHYYLLNNHDINSMQTKRVHKDRMPGDTCYFCRVPNSFYEEPFLFEETNNIMFQLRTWKVGVIYESKWTPWHTKFRNSGVYIRAFFIYPWKNNNYENQKIRFVLWHLKTTLLVPNIALMYHYL